MLRKRQSTPLPSQIIFKEPKVSKTYSTPHVESLAKKGLQKEKPLNDLPLHDFKDTINIKMNKKNNKNSSSEPQNKSGFENNNEIKNNILDVEIIDDDAELLDSSSSFVVDSLEDSENFEEVEFELLPNPEIVDGERKISSSFDTLLLDDEEDDDEDLSNFENNLFTDFESEESSNLPQVTSARLPNVFVRDNLQLYLREISSFPMLTPEEELEFAHKVRESNDPDAAFRLISSHLRLVVKVAMEFQKRWMQNVLDLIQEGNIGLVRAVNKFDPDKGIKFSYYAKFWIRAYILKFIMDNWRMVKIGTTQAQRKLFYNLNKEKQKLISQGFDPDIDVLVDKLGVSKEDILEMEQRLESTDLSLDTPVGDESGSVSRIEYLPALTQGIEEGFAESEITDIIHAKLEKFIPMLSDKEIFILENRLLTDDPITLREIGEKYNVTRERIRQLEARLVEKMRTYLTAEIDDFSEDWI